MSGVHAVMKSNETLRRATFLLTNLRRAPKMYAATRESMLAYISGIMLMCIDFKTIEFYKKHLDTYGNTYLGVLDDFEDAWAQSVIDDALNLLEEH